MEMSIWETPREVKDMEKYQAMVNACVELWKDHQISRAATPEVGPDRPDNIVLPLINGLVQIGTRALARLEIMGGCST